MSEEEVIKQKLAEFVSEMRPLDAEFAQILNDNLWDLYMESNKDKELHLISDFFDEEDDEEQYLATLEEWHDMYSNDWFNSDDGDAYYGTKTHYSHISAFREDPPQWATHVILFGK